MVLFVRFDVVAFHPFNGSGLFGLDIEIENPIENELNSHKVALSFRSGSYCALVTASIC